MDSQDSAGSNERPASERAAQAAQKAREFAASIVQQQKQRAASGLGQFSSAIRDTATRLQDEKDATLAGYAEVVAERLERAADYVGTSDPSTMLSDAQRFAKRRPEIVIGGMFVAGVALARFLKAGVSANTSPAAEDTYVPHSKRDVDAAPDKPKEAPGQFSQSHETAGFRSPRGLGSAAPGLFNRPVEAAGGEFNTDSFDNHDRPDTNTESL
jgi:hypothetical protein